MYCIGCTFQTLGLSTKAFNPLNAANGMKTSQCAAAACHWLKEDLTKGACSPFNATTRMT